MTLRQALYGICVMNVCLPPKYWVGGLFLYLLFCSFEIFLSFGTQCWICEFLKLIHQRCHCLWSILGWSKNCTILWKNSKNLIDFTWIREEWELIAFWVSLVVWDDEVSILRSCKKVDGLELSIKRILAEVQTSFTFSSN